MPPEPPSSETRHPSKDKKNHVVGESICHRRSPFLAKGVYEAAISSINPSAQSALVDRCRLCPLPEEEAVVVALAPSVDDDDDDGTVVLCDVIVSVVTELFPLVLVLVLLLVLVLSSAAEVEVEAEVEAETVAQVLV